MRSTAGMALRRATTKASPSSGSSVEKTSVAWFSSHSPAISSHSAAAWPAGSSDWMTSIAAASRSSPILVRSSTALMVGRSMNSSIEGRSRRVMASTVAVASSRVANVATRVAGGRCVGTSRSTISVMIPSVPSEPTNSLVSDSPATSLSRAPPSSTAVPSASTTVRPRT